MATNTVQKLIESRFVSGPNDELAVQDIYGIVESKLAGFGLQGLDLSFLKGILSEAFRIGKSFLSKIFKPIIDLLKKLFDFLKERINAFLNLLPFNLKSLLSNFVLLGLEDLGFASLGPFWNYAGQIIAIDPNDRQTYEAARGIIESLRNSPNSPNANQSLLAAVDQGAEAIVYSKLVEAMLKGQINPPIKEIITGLSTDLVRRGVAEKVFPTAINPSAKPGPGPKDALVTDPVEIKGSKFTGLLYSPAVSIAERFEKSTATTPAATTIWSNRPVQASSNPDRPNWTVAPATPYLNALKFVPTNVAGSDKALEFAGVRENAKGSNVRLPAGTGYSAAVLDDLLSFTTPEQLIALYPGLLGMLLYFYTLPSGEWTLKGEYDGLIGRMNTLLPGWYQSLRDKKTISNLLHFAKASEDAIFVMSTYDQSEFVAESLIAAAYPYNDVIELLKAQYPLAAIV